MSFSSSMMSKKNRPMAGAVYFQKLSDKKD